MKALFKIAFAGLLLAAPAGLLAQRPAMVKNIEIGIRENKAVISYDIKSRDKGSLHNIHLEFIDEDYNLVTPSLLSGHVGSGIQSGTGRTIEWDITNDVQLLGSRITPVFFVDGISKQYSNTGGSGYAMLSFLMPGLGDYFVADRRVMKFKPYMRTVSSLGLIALGLYVGEQRYRAEGTWRTVLKADSWRYTGEERYFERFFEGEIQYLWFKGDKELLISLGAAIWAADIIWVLAKGSNNSKFIRKSSEGSGMNLGYCPGGLCLQYHYTF